MDPTVALIILILWIVVPTLHVVFSPSAGPWTMPEGSTCPFSPRVGWLVIVLLLGFIGWILFLRTRWRLKKQRPSD